jgi:acyl carrier protein
VTELQTRDEQIQEQVIALVRTMAPVPAESLNLATRLVDDLGYTSLRLFELAIVLESQFAVDLPMEETMHVRTIGDVRSLVAQLISQQG